MPTKTNPQALDCMYRDGTCCTPVTEAPLGDGEAAELARVLISGTRRGKWVWWHANPDRLAGIRKALGA